MPDAIAATVGSGQVIDALQYDFGSGQVVAVGATAASSTALLYPYTAATITSTTNCWYSIGATAVAHGAASEYLPAGLKIKVKFAAGQTISVIQDTAGGFLSIMPTSNPNIAPLLLDTVGVAAAGAYSLRLLTAAYAGPAINIRRSSDNTTQNIGFTAAGDFDLVGFKAFVGSGSGFVATWYDQSGNANHAVQATAAAQPQLVTGVAALNSRPAPLYTNGGPMSLSAPAAASINDVFAGGGTLSLVTFLSAIPTGNARFESKGSTFFRVLAATTIMDFSIAAATSAGDWQAATQLGTSSAHVVDIQYSSASLSNVPTITVDGSARSLSVSTQPVGAITSDAGGALLAGGAGGTTAIPGYLPELILWKSQPAMAGVRSNQKAYWGTP